MSYQEQANEKAGYRPFDIATLAYIGFQLVIFAIYSRTNPGPYDFLGMYLTRFGLFSLYLAAAMIVVIFSFIPPSGAFKLIRLTYPMFMITFFYEALKSQIFFIHGYPFDNTIISIEHAILGFDSSFALQRFMSFSLNEIMNFFYISYYFMVPLIAILLAFKGSWKLLEKLTLAVLVTFYISYGIFILYPVVGPRLYLSDIYYLPLLGSYFTPLAQQIVESGGLHGGAMPSSHCAVALVAIWFLVKEFKHLKIPGYFTLVMLCISTIYGRYHYLSDVVVGLFLGFLCIWLTARWQEWYFKNSEIVRQSDVVEPQKITVEG